MTTQLVVTNETEDVAEVRKAVIGTGREGEKHGISFGEGVTYFYTVGAAEDEDDVATDLRSQINSGSLPYTASGATNEVIVTADRAGRVFTLGVTHPNDHVELVTAAEQAVDVILPRGFSRTVPAEGNVLLTMNTSRLEESDLVGLNALVLAGKVSTLPALSAITLGEVDGLDIPTGIALEVRNVTVKGDISVTGTLNLIGCHVEGDTAMDGGVLDGTDTFFEGDLDNASVAGTVTLVGGRIMGTGSGTITHDAGDVGT